MSTHPTLYEELEGGGSVEGSPPFVINRAGTAEPYDAGKIIQRLERLSNGLEVVPFEVADRVRQKIGQGTTTEEIDRISATVANYMSLTVHPDYTRLAGRIETANVHRGTPTRFSDAMRILHKDAGLVAEQFWTIVERHAHELDSAIRPERDFDLDYRAIEVFKKGYLLRDAQRRIVERPQYTFMRVALFTYRDDIVRVIENYHMISTRQYTPPSPNFYNACLRFPQMASCFVYDTPDDIHGITAGWTSWATVCKYGGGLGIRLSRLRGQGAAIKSVNGQSTGIMPLAQVVQKIMKYVSQGSKRPGQANIYLDIMHPQSVDLLRSKLQSAGAVPEMHLESLNVSVCLPGVFMTRLRRAVRENQPVKFTLFAPEKHPDLYDCYGDKFTALYERLEAEGHGHQTIDDVRELANMIFASRAESGMPYVFFTDNVNEHSNHDNIGKVHTSNLCMEICEVTEPGKPAICNLAAVVLPTHVVHAGDGTPRIDYRSVATAASHAAAAVDVIMDHSYYPETELTEANNRTRPMGIGMTGLATLFFLMRVPFESPQAMEISTNCTAAVYYGALRGSCDRARRLGASYPDFAGSHFSRGELQFDLYERNNPGFVPALMREDPEYFDWDQLRADMRTYGMRNSLLTALMPNATTGSATMVSDCFEPVHTLMFQQKTLSGTFPLVCRELVLDLIALGLWSDKVAAQIARDGGSIQGIKGIPRSLKDIYKNVWEMPQKVLVDLAVARQRYIDQSQSLNLFMAKPTTKASCISLIYAWEQGIKTLYYLRTRSKVESIQVMHAPEAPSPGTVTPAPTPPADDSCGDSCGI